MKTVYLNEDNTVAEGRDMIPCMRPPTAPECGNGWRCSTWASL